MASLQHGVLDCVSKFYTKLTSMLWVFSWGFILPWLINLLSHFGQLYGFSPAWGSWIVSHNLTPIDIFVVGFLMRLLHFTIIDKPFVTLWTIEWLLSSTQDGLCLKILHQLTSLLWVFSWGFFILKYNWQASCDTLCNCMTFLHYVGFPMKLHFTTIDTVN